MSDVVVLGDAILALVPDTRPTYEGRAPSDARPPWQIVSVRVPQVAERGMARRGQVNHATLLVKCVAGTAKGARMMLTDAHATLEGARPVAAGWNTTPLEQINVRWDPTEGTTTVIAGATVPVFEAIAEYRCTASPTA